MAGPPRQLGYGQWLVSRMRDVRAVLADPSTTVDLVAPKALDHFRSQHGVTAENTMAIMRTVARTHRTTNDAERLDAIAVTKLLGAALPEQDMRASLRPFATSGAVTADAMSAVMQPILKTWRAAVLGIDAEMGQKAEDGLLRLIVLLEQAGVGGLAEAEPIAAETMRVLSMIAETRSQCRNMPVAHWISPAFLALLPMAYTGVSMLAHLAENPELQEEVRLRPDLRPGYLREAERLLNAFRYPRRQQTGPAGLDLGDTWLPPRNLVVLDLAAANRDPLIWDSPDLCRPNRLPQPTAAFSFGPLACTGGQLSRQFLSRLLDVTLDTVRLSLPPPDTEPDRIHTRLSMMRGYTMCRLQFSAL